MSEKPGAFRFQPFPVDTVYEFRINGRLSEPILAWFEDMEVKVDETTSPPQTRIYGPMRDQAALYGFVNRIRDLGLVLLSVNLASRKEDS